MTSALPEWKVVRLMLQRATVAPCDCYAVSALHADVLPPEHFRTERNVARLFPASCNCALCDRDTVSTHHVYLLRHGQFRTKWEFAHLSPALCNVAPATAMWGMSIMLSCFGTSTSTLSGELRGEFIQHATVHLTTAIPVAATHAHPP